MSDDITELVDRARSGEAGARDALFAAAYGESRVLARARLRDGGRHTLLDTTALVHESYLRYFGGYSEIQIAEALQVTDRTVRCDWEKTRLLLLAMLRG